MDSLEWLMLFVTLLWASIPLIAVWIQIVLLIPTVDRSVFFLNEPPKIITPCPPPAREDEECFRNVSLQETRPDLLEETDLLCEGVAHQKWKRSCMMECVLYSRRMYGVMRQAASIMLPIDWWIPTWVIIWATKSTAAFFLWREFDAFPEGLAGALIMHAFCSSVIELLWFPLFFRMRKYNVATAIVCVYAVATWILYGFRWFHNADVGAGLFTAEVVYYSYVSIATLCIIRENDRSHFLDNDMLDRTKIAPVAVFMQDTSVHQTLTADFSHVHRDISTKKEKSLQDTRDYQESLRIRGMQAPTPGIPGTRAMGWYVNTKVKAS